MREDGEGDETIQKAVEVMREEKVRGNSLLKLTAASLERWGIPGGPAAVLAGRIQRLQARKVLKSNESLRFLSVFVSCFCRS